jgi:hypothetical protein
MHSAVQRRISFADTEFAQLKGIDIGVIASSWLPGSTPFESLASTSTTATSATSTSATLSTTSTTTLNPPAANIDGDSLFGNGVTTMNRWSPGLTQQLAHEARVVQHAVLNENASDHARKQARQKLTLCQFYGGGGDSVCLKGNACEFAHVGPSEVRVCSFFVSDSCTKGESCPFSHGSLDLQCFFLIENIQTTNIDLSLVPCKFFMAGKCENGSLCRFAHQQQRR